MACGLNVAIHHSSELALLLIWRPALCSIFRFKASIATGASWAPRKTTNTSRSRQKTPKQLARRTTRDRPMQWEYRWLQPSSAPLLSCTTYSMSLFYVLVAARPSRMCPASNCTTRTSTRRIASTT
uniref:Secreted protein n=1 Tax=Ixodes ricinus TaxID=34613 RepID=A0A6B0UQ58_IXORI